MKKKYRISREKEYRPYHNLIGAAKTELELAEKEEPGYFFFQMNTMLLSALAIEALANSFGEHLFEKWDDFESSRPLAKIRLIAERLNLDYDLKKEPWATLPFLISFRNSIVHGKPESVTVEKELTEEEFIKKHNESPRSKVEEKVSLPNAKRALREIEKLKGLFCHALPADETYDFFGESWSGSSDHHPET